MNLKLSHLIIPCIGLCALNTHAQDPQKTTSGEEYTISDESVEDLTNEGDKSESPERAKGEVPAMFRDDSKLDASYIDQELGVNVYTAPSISKIFDQLEGLPSIPDDYVLRKRPDLLPTESGALALEMGFLLADGFIAVRSGRMNDIKPIALDLSRYGKAMGVGDRMNIHSASLLEQAEKGLLEKFKETLAATQEDVNAELRALRDPDQPHLIALGGWVRALTASAAALHDNFDATKAAALFYHDAPDYFCEILDGVNPMSAEKLKIQEMKEQLRLLSSAMKLDENKKPTKEQILTILVCGKKLSTYCVGAGYEY